MADLQFYNTLTRQKALFEPLDAKNIRIYACGPTVYDRIHVGNARPVVLFDTLVRLLRYHFPKVTYVRNITDVDDKINARASTMGISIAKLTKGTIQAFHEDCEALKSLPPDIEPRATEHIRQMIEMIDTLIKKKHAYETDGHVLFDVKSMADYGQLSRRSAEELLAGARVEVADFKKNAGDFVLWKPSEEGQPAWQSPWGRGRPGWHIECSAMSGAHLGEVFDIHAGGLDLIFPHHENEIAQSRCAYGHEMMAQVWMHNGYVLVNGEKMAKSLGNFITVADLLKKYPGEAVRYALLSGHYRAPLDFSMESVGEAQSCLDRLYRAVIDAQDDGEPDEEFLQALGDDLNSPNALARLHGLARAANKGDVAARDRLKASANLIGLLTDNPRHWGKHMDSGDLSKDFIVSELVKQREQARANKNYAEADRIRDELAESDIILEDTPEGTIWRRK